jgi:hypothetical protein
MTYRFTIPLRTVSGANVREHWAKKNNRVKRERAATKLFADQAGVQPILSNQAATVTLTRIAPRPLDSDNLATSFKAVRDEIALVLGLADDRDGYWLTWHYAQRRGKPKEYAVEVHITIAAQAAAAMQGGR